jgi:hypothetical protein
MLPLRIAKVNQSTIATSDPGASRQGQVAKQHSPSIPRNELVKEPIRV